MGKCADDVDLLAIQVDAVQLLAIKPSAGGVRGDDVGNKRIKIKIDHRQRNIDESPLRSGKVIGGQFLCRSHRNIKDKQFPYVTRW